MRSNGKVNGLLTKTQPVYTDCVHRFMYLTVLLRLLIELNAFNHFYHYFSKFFRRQNVRCHQQMSPISSHKNVKNIARHRAISKISKSSEDKKTRCSYSILIDHENRGTLEQKFLILG